MDLRGHLDLLLLATLIRMGPVHGYALIAALRDGSEGAFDLPEGTVYPALHRLEREGLVHSWWEETAPRRRRTYQVTTAGEAAHSAKTAEWARFVTGMQALLGSPRPGIATSTHTGELWRRTRWAH